MKINYTKWRKHYSTPYISILPNDAYIQISLIVWTHHWWIIINKKK